MRERCSEHGLAVGPDGACVLCRSRRRATRQPQLFVPIGLLGAIAVGLGLWKVVGAAMGGGLLASESANASALPTYDMGADPATIPSAAAGSAVVAGRYETLTFSERDPRGLSSELRARGESDADGDYVPAKESCVLWLPAAALAGKPQGLLVWISSASSGALPSPEWRSVLAAHHLVWAGPNRVGNEREISARIGLALDSVQAVSSRFALDR
jgi:hypothetical protein